MKRLLIFSLLLLTTKLFAQSYKIDSDKMDSNMMRWNCPEIEHYQDLIASLHNEDVKIWATNVMDKFDLYAASPTEKYIITQAVLKVENPNYEKENLLNIIAAGLKQKGWGKKLTISKTEYSIQAIHTVEVAVHSTFFETFKVSVTPILSIAIAQNNNIIIQFVADNYTNAVYSNSNNTCTRKMNEKVTDVFPFNKKSSNKNTYSRAYIGTYVYFWDFISKFRDFLNINFTQDDRFLEKKRYKELNDSLFAKYGEPTKVIYDGVKSMDINSEIRFYEKAQKVCFMGKTINFNDIISCEIVDDPTIIPSRSTTVGAGIGLFGFGLTGNETYTTPEKIIHNYVVIIKIDNLDLPFIHIVTGTNDLKAKEIASSFEYILRHQKKETKSVGYPRKRK